VLLTIIDIVLKASVVLTMAALVAAALRRASASTRHFVWTLGMLGALAAPLLSAALPRWEVPIVRVQAPAPAAPAPTVATGPAHAGQTPIAYVGQTPAAPLPASGSRTPAVAHSGQLALASVSWTTVLLMAWAAGALLILGRVLLGLVAVQWMSRRMALVNDASWMPLANELAADLGLRRVRFMRAGHASMPMAWGIFRPSVLMPADADEWPSDRLRIVLLHELAHVKRRDCLTHLFAQMAFAAYWFNPLAWIAARHLRTERERACDDLVLAAGTRGSDYADQLLDIARVMRAGRFPAVLAGASLAMAHRSQLEGRLMAILDPTVPRRALSRVRAAVVLATFAMLVAPVAAVQPWTQDDSGQSPAVTASQSDPVVAKADQKVDRKIEQQTERTVAVKQGHRAPADGVSGGVSGGVAEGVPGGVIGGVVGGVVQGVGTGIAEGVADGVSSGVAAAVASRHPTPMPMPMPMAVQGAGSHAKGERDPRTVDALIEALKDSDSGVRGTAMEALSHMRDPRLFDPFVAALHDANPEVREQAAFALGQLRDRRAIAPLSEALKDEKANVREQVVFALGQLRALFGSRVDRLFAGGSHLVTRWDADPFVGGAYSFVRPGDADARLALARPVDDGRLLFAGEACHNGMAGTVAGAWISGQDAARAAA